MFQRLCYLYFCLINPYSISLKNKQSMQVFDQYFLVYLTTRGEKPKEHGIKQELVSSCSLKTVFHLTYVEDRVPFDLR